MCRVILKRSLLALPAGASSALFQPLAGPLSRGLIQQRELSCGNSRYPLLWNWATLLHSHPSAPRPQGVMRMAPRMQG